MGKRHRIANLFLLAFAFLLANCGGNGGDGSGSSVPIPPSVTRSWGTAQLIETGNAGDARSPDIAMDASGSAIAVWSQYDGTGMNIWANQYVAGIGWRTAHPIETDDIGGYTTPQIAMDPIGNAIVVWLETLLSPTGYQYNVWANRYNSAGWSWETPVLIATNTLGAQIAMDSSGNAIAVWSQSGGSRYHIWANRRPFAGLGWGTAVPIETDNVEYAMEPQIAMDASGNAIAVWQQGDGTLYHIWANRYVAGAGWGTAELIETNNLENAASPQVAMDSTGNALAVWRQNDGTRNHTWANRYVAGAGWGTAQLIETDNAGDVFIPEVAMDSGGNAIAVWSQSDGTRSHLWANRYVAGTGWGTAQLIETDNAGIGGAGSAQIAMDSSGNAITVWYHGGARRDIWANRYVAGTGWGTAQLIETDNAGDALFPQIAMDASGNAITVWQQHDGGRDNIWANQFN